MSNNLRTRNGMPFNFVNGLKVRGMDIESLLPGIEGIPEAGSKYQFAGNGSVKSFTLPVSPYNKDAVDVYVKQLYVHPDDYTLVGDTVTLVEAPPAVVAGETYNVVIKVSLTTLNGYVNANRVSFEGENLDDILEKGKPLANYSNLRAYAGAATQVRITDPGIAGFFYYDASDTVSADNGGTIIVAGNGKRWKRLFDGIVNVFWFMSYSEYADVLTSVATLDVAPVIQRTIDSLAAKGGTILFPSGSYRLASSITPKSSVSLTGTSNQSIVLDNKGVILKPDQGVSAFAVSSGFLDDCIVENITIYCAAANGGGDAFRFDPGTHWRNSKLKNVSVRGMRRAINITTNVDWQMIVIEDCRFAYQMNEHIYSGLGSTSGAIHYLNTRFEQTANGYNLVSITSPSGDIRFTGCVIEGCAGQYAISIDSNPNSVTFNGCHFEANGINSTNSADVYIGAGRGSVGFNNCAFSGPGTGAVGFYNLRLADNNVNRITFNACTVNLNTFQVASYGGIAKENRGGKFVTAINTSYFGSAMSTFDFWNSCKNAVRLNDSTVPKNGHSFIGNRSSMHTTDATYTTIWTTNGYTFEIAKPGIYLLTATIQCINSDGSIYGTWVRRSVISTNSANTATIRGYMDTVPVTSGGTLDARFTLTANGIEGVGVKIEVCGIAATDIAWQSVVNFEYITHS